MSIIPQVLFLISVLAAVLAAYGFLVGDFWLASTQWLLVAGVLGIWSIWLKLK